MKKNIAMRVAAILFILTMISTCAFSTTFAKYVTSAKGKDTARVAKWGVTVAVKGDNAFGIEYNDNITTGGTKVISIDGTNVVAPGTNDDFASVTIKGKPEVNSKITFTVTSADGDDKATDIYLKAGEYTDYTSVDWNATPAKTFTLSDDYHPILFSVKKTVTAEGTTETITTELDLTLAELEKYLEDESDVYASVAAKTFMDYKYEISWSWAFDTKDHASSNDAADTYLGNIAAGIVTPGVDTYSTEISFKINVVVEQID